MGNYCKIYTKSKMKLLLSLFLVSAVFGAPAPQDEDIEAVPYVHNEIEAEPYVHDEPLETHDIVAETYVHEEIAAEPYVHEDIAAEAYVHEEPVETHDIEAEAYVHEDIAAEPYVHEEPTAAVGTAVVTATYAAYPLTYSLPAVSAPAVYKVASAPQTYAIAAPYYVAAVKTGCINNVGSVVPCAQ